MQKKSLTLLGIVLAWIIILSFLFVHTQNNEMSLAESMIEKMETLLTKIQ